MIRVLCSPLYGAGLAILGGCAKQAPAAEHAGRAPVVTRDAVAAYEAKPEGSACAAMGPFSCDLPPSTTKEELCSQVAKCVAMQDPDKAGLTISGCGELSDFEPAPAESGVKSIAVINVDGSLRGVNGQGSFLVAQREEGFCVIDQAVRWEDVPDGYLDTDSRLDWRSAGGRMLLAVQTQAVNFAEEESEDGEASVRSSLCRNAEYALVGGRFRTVSERANDEPCDDE